MASIENDNKYWGSVEDAFQSIREDAKRLSVPVLLVIFPVPSSGNREVWDTYPYEEIHRKVEAEGALNGFVVIDLLPHFQAWSGDTLRVSCSDGHPSVFAHNLVGRILAERILADFGDWD